jgi:hypothetical protein
MILGCDTEVARNRAFERKLSLLNGFTVRGNIAFQRLRDPDLWVAAIAEE